MAMEVSENDRVLTFAISGDIDHHSAQQMREGMDDKIRTRRPIEVVIELSDMQFMDSSGLGLILGRVRTCETVGARLTVKNPGERVRLILDMAGAGDYLQYA